MLVPEVAQGSAKDLDDLRAACDKAVAGLVAAQPDHIAVIGGGPLDTFWSIHAGGSLKPYGVDLHAGGETDELPLSLTIGAWLLDRAGWTGSRAYATADLTPHGRTALLVMADGSAKLTSEAPGYFDERAEPFDRAISEALAGGDSDTLALLDEDLADELWCGGAQPLKALGRMTKGATIEARLHYDEAPFGVGYWVADWKLS